VSTRVLIADDQALVRAGFRKLLESAPGIEVVGEASDGREAVDQARRLRPSIVLMDIRMPRLDGIEATRRLTGSDGDAIRVLILTTFGLDDYVYDALRAGASGFMLKDAPPEELLAAIEVVARGDALIAPAVTRSVIEEFVRRSPAHSPPPALLDERGDRRAPRGQRRHRQDARRARALKAGRARPRAGGDPRLRVGRHHARPGRVEGSPRTGGSASARRRRPG
jgi:DNA-binding NarL/FixJ family response regulator